MKKTSPAALLRRARQVLDIEIAALKGIRAGIGKDFYYAAAMLLDCLDNHGKIVVTGVGKNLHVAGKVSATLTSTGSTSVWLNPMQAMHGDLGVFCDNDVLLVLSYSGESDELRALLPAVKRLGVRIIAITAGRKNTLAKHSNVVIPARVEREACPFNMAPTSSTTAALAVGDALAMVLLDARGFKKDNYARFHPGGAIGRTLLLRVSDIMRTGKHMASVTQNASVRSALLAMTAAKAGSVGVIERSGRLMGIFTDGDLRRHMFENRDILNVKITEVMTRDPFTVRPDKLAAEVLDIFERHNFDDLPVVDDARKLVGMVDIQDLPKLKIL